MKTLVFTCASLLLAFALPARAVDCYFNSLSRQIEDAVGTPFSPQRVAGVNATLFGGLPGIIVGDDTVEFHFPAALHFPATDRVFFRGTRPVRIVVAGTITVPSGMLMDATGGASRPPLKQFSDTRLRP